jgi:hypothetical protein
VNQAIGKDSGFAMGFFIISDFNLIPSLMMVLDDETPNPIDKNDINAIA